MIQGQPLERRVGFREWSAGAGSSGSAGAAM